MKGKQFLFQMWHLECFSCYKHGDKSWMRKGPDSNNDQEGTCPVVISNTNILKLLTRSWWFV